MRLPALLALLAAGDAAAARPQPEPPPVSPTAAPKALPSIPDALALLRKAYREAPVTDRVTLLAANADGRERRVQAVVYTDRGLAAKPGDPSVKPRPAQARVDLGQLQIHIKDKVLTALNVFDRTTFFRADCSDDVPASLAAHFPPIPLPQIHLAFAEQPALADPAPLVTSVTWSAVEAATEFGRPMLTLKGDAPSGPVTLTFDRQSGRVRKFIARFTAAAGPAVAKLELTSSPGDAGDAKNWLLPVDGRTRVDSPALLVPPRSGLGPGSSIRHASLMTSELAPLAPEALFAAPPGGAAPATVILVAFRTEAFAAGFSAEDLAAALSAAREASQTDAAKAAGPLVLRAVGLLGKNEMDPEKIRDVVAKAHGAVAKAGVPGMPAALLTASDVLTVERGGQAVDVSILVLGPDLKARGVVVADHRASEPAKVRDELAPLLIPPPKPAEPKPGETKPGEGTPAKAPEGVPATKPDGPKGPSGTR